MKKYESPTQNTGKSTSRLSSLQLKRSHDEQKQAKGAFRKDARNESNGIPPVVKTRPAKKQKSRNHKHTTLGCAGMSFGKRLRFTQFSAGGSRLLPARGREQESGRESRREKRARYFHEEREKDAQMAVLNC